MDANHSCEVKDWLKLLQPDLLHNEEIIQILNSRFVKVDDIGQLDRPKLVELCERIAMPLPQRQYPNTARGRLLTKHQHKRNKIVLGETAKPESGFAIGLNGMRAATTKTASTNWAAQSPTDRLKPPPDAVNFARKKIKLNSSICVSQPAANLLDRVVIKRKPRELDTTSKSDTAACETVVKTATPEVTTVNRVTKKVMLKRNHLAVKSPVTQMKIDSEDHLPNKKRVKISWP